MPWAAWNHLSGFRYFVALDFDSSFLSGNDILELLNLGCLFLYLHLRRSKLPIKLTNVLLNFVYVLAKPMNGSMSLMQIHIKLIDIFTRFVPLLPELHKFLVDPDNLVLCWSVPTFVERHDFSR